MQRRQFFGALTSGFIAMAGEPETPRNAVCLRNNEFDKQHKVWAEQMNEHHEPRTIHMHPVEAWDPLPKLWRRVEAAWRRWVLGNT